MYKFILFDLDGTIINSAQGISESIKYALDKLDYDYKDLDFVPFFGPSLYYSFGKFCGFDYPKQVLAVKYYREIYETENVYKCEIYGGVKSLIQKLKNDGYKIALATGKPLRFAKVILKYLDIIDYFDDIEGICSDDQTKADMINLAMKNLNAIKSETIMVGGRDNDIIGANQCGIHSIGILYGFGSFQELKNAKATYLCDTPDDVYNLLTQKN